MKRILVTGGAGFIGSHLCERFVQDGPLVPLEQGLEKTIEYFRQNYSF